MRRFDTQSLRARVLLLSLLLAYVPFVVTLVLASRMVSLGWFLLVGLGAAALAGLLFAWFLGKTTRELEQLAQAAERIGRGEFDVWLPPPGSDEAGRLSFAIGRMASRLKELVEQLTHAGQMAALGEFASYVSHEIRNPLSSLQLNLQSLKRAQQSGTSGPDDLESVELCLREVTRLDQVVTSVLRLGRTGGTGAPVLTALHAVLREAVDLLQPEISRREVRLYLELAASDDWVRGDAHQLEGAFLNLLINAVEAVGESGSILIATADGAVEGRPGIEVMIRDTGPGVPAALRSRIFEPFFTTRPDGSGIGLALASQTVRDHGGALRLEQPSAVGQGATFVATLPLLAEEPSAPEPPPTPRSLHRAGARRRRPAPQAQA